MCHAVPARVTAILPDEQAQVDLGGAKKIISTALVGAVVVGEYLLVHVGYALGKVDEAEAAATLAALGRIGGGE